MRARYPGQTLPRILLICGEDTDLKRYALEDLRSRAKAAGHFEWHVRNAATTPLVELLNEAGTPALFGGLSIFVAENGDRLLKRASAKNEDSDPLRLLKRFEGLAAPPACLALVTSLKPKAAEALGVGQVVACWPLEDRDGRPDLTRWTLACARERCGKRLEADAAAALLSRTGNALGRIRDALQSLAIYTGDRPAITAADVEALVGGNPQVHAFALADAASQADAPKALGLLRRLLEGGERPEAVLYVLAFHCRRLSQALARMEQGASPSQAADDLGVRPLFKPAMLHALQRLTPRAGDRALGILRETDRRHKSGRGKAALERAVVRLCAPTLAAGSTRG